MLKQLYLWLNIAAICSITIVEAIDIEELLSPEFFKAASEGTIESAVMSLTSGSLLPTTTIPEVPMPTNIQSCNGHVDFCTRSYGNITYVGAHNSPFVRENNVAANQNLEVTQQLDDGIRMLQGQTHVVNGTLHYCHTSCNLLDSGPIEDYFIIVADWLRKNPYEVISVLIGNGDFVDVEQFVEPLKNSGLADMAYIPENKTMEYHEWPTLGDLILQKKRVIVFMDYKADETRVPYILNEFTYMWETPFSPTDPSFPCTIDRPSGMRDDEGKLYMANQNLNAQLSVFGETILIPDKVNLNRTNAVSGFGSLGQTAEQCIALWGRPPTFLLVDFYEVGSGSVFEVAAKLNKVEYNNKSCCSIPETSNPATVAKSALGLQRLMVFSLIGLWVGQLF